MKIKNDVKAEIEKTDIIHSFIPQARTLKNKPMEWAYIETIKQKLEKVKE
ncbi:hypothetical protein [Helicobacter pylori]|nr:hypothetical protein [Helicobacter pylori]